MRNKQKRMVQIIFVSLAVPLLTMCATIVVLNQYMPRYRAMPATMVQETAVAVPEAAIAEAVPVVSIAAPMQIKISKITVDAVINPVGLTAEGNMDIDENPVETAWYEPGPKPGQVGSAVVAGHYGWKKSVPSVFNDLNKLVAGDEVQTIGEDGQTLTFVVTRLATFEPDQDATEVFRSYDGKAHLNLVTCQGSWNNTASTYTERLVVFTDFVK